MSCLYPLPGAATVKNHRMSGSDNRIKFSHSMEATRVRSRCRQVAPSEAMRETPSQAFPQLLGCVGDPRPS